MMVRQWTRNLTYLVFGFVYKLSEFKFSQSAFSFNMLFLLEVMQPKVSRVLLRTPASSSLAPPLATPDHIIKMKMERTSTTCSGTEDV